MNKKELSKSIQSKYREMNSLFVNKKLSEKKLTDSFLDLFEEIFNQVNELLLHKNKEIKNKNLNKIYHNSFKKAIYRIVEIKSKKKEKLWFSIFVKSETWTKNTKNNEQKEKSIKKEFLNADKYLRFLRVYYELFLNNKDIKIKISEEILNKTKRKLAYNIIHIYWKKINKTILISDQIWQATFIYDWLINPSFLKTVWKWEEIKWIKPIVLIYSPFYEEHLDNILNESWDFSQNILIKEDDDFYLNEKKYYYHEFIKNTLSVITDKEWKKIKADLKTELPPLKCSGNKKEV